jgi:transposase InsO family protein
VSTFCVEHGISRETFYVIRRRAVEEGQAAALEPRSRRPATSPTRIPEDVKAQAVAVRAALESSGLDHGPISVFERMKSMGLTPPSVASLARIFREKGVARLEPKKKPRAAYRRFVYPAPNACWQMDATEYVLTRGRPCVIFQLIDDHSRAEVASHVAWSETADAAIETFDKAVGVHGVPQRLLTDNGVALNPSRRGYIGQLVAHVTALGVEPITGKPYKPTTQGKNERAHQTLLRWLDKQPLAETLEQLQAQIDEFDNIYNYERPHQGLPGRITPMTAYQATPKADAPRPQPERPEPPRPPATKPKPGPRTPRTLPAGTSRRTINSNGTITINWVTYAIGGRYAYHDALVTIDDQRIIITDLHGEILIEHTRHEPGTGFVGVHQARYRRPHPHNRQQSPET